MNFAKVSIIFSNEDRKLPIELDEVEVTRKVYRDGESKYLINNKNVRLKDIRELLDTGVGKEGYSIISQGKIDEILSSKPNERRKIIDEASGIAKFKYQKEESLKKLKNTDENLIRIKDILYGLEEKYEFLKAEANKAERGLLLSKELKNNEFSFYMNQKQQEDLKNQKA